MSALDLVPESCADYYLADALLLATHLSLRGRLGHRSVVVDALEAGRGGSLRTLMVRALSRGANAREATNAKL